MSDIYQFNVGGTTYNLANLGLLAPVQITLTADRLYNTGDQFIYTGLLYEATETIAQGTSITIGSNAQLADCVTKQISEINSNLLQGGTGYSKLPDGTLIQCGRFTVNESGNMTQINTIGIYTKSIYFTFPMRFYDGNYTVVANSRYSTGNIVPAGCVKQSTGYCLIELYDFVARPLNDGQLAVEWQAIGRWK